MKTVYRILVGDKKTVENELNTLKYKAMEMSIEGHSFSDNTVSVIVKISLPTKKD